MQNNEKTNNKKNALLVLRYNRTLPNIRNHKKKLHTLLINPEFRNVFVNKPTRAYKRNENIQDLIGGHIIKNGKVAKK